MTLLKKNKKNNLSKIIFYVEDENLKEITDLFKEFHQMSWFKINSMWIIEIYNKDELDIKKILKSVTPSSKIKSYRREIIEDKDWVVEGTKVNINIKTEFFLITQNLSSVNRPKKKYSIRIPASIAFGTGTHASTFLSIKSIEFLYKFKNFKNILDLGTGSGVLCFALSKLTKKKIFCSDFDQNSKINFLSNKKINYVNNVKFVKAYGLDSKEFNLRKFDLIVANILLNPLINLFNSINKHTADNSYLILSGILENQANHLYSYYSYRYILEKKFTNKSWTTLVLKKNGKKL